MEYVTYVVVGFWLLTPVASWIVATLKGRSVIIWTLLTLCLSPVSLVVLLFLPSVKQCPFCATSIPKQATVCGRCQRPQLVESCQGL